MSSPKSTRWPLEPHTRAKHAILKRYLQAWTPILSQAGFPALAYVDGFSGPGQYAGGEDGSPIIALTAALRQQNTIRANVRFYFVEKDSERAEYLQSLVSRARLPTNFRVDVIGGKSFAEAFDDIHKSYGVQGLPPTFAFIDPFGWTGVPFETIRTILRYPSCEVLVNFMFEEINRFLSHRHQGTNFDEFFGTPEWREGIDLTDKRERNRFLHDLYARQLEQHAGARFVRSFEMRNSNNVVDYYLFYATKSERGLMKMKEAMWKVDESGEFTFSDATNPAQLVLFERQPRFDLLERALIERFRGIETTVEQVGSFVVRETAFRETHFKTQVLKKLELSQPPRLQIVDSPASRKRGTFADPHMRLRFL